MKFNDRVTQNAHKIHFIASVYQENNLVTLSQYFQIPPIEFNAAAWAGKEMGLFEIDDQNNITLASAPEKYQFGELVDHLLDIIPFTIGKINETEAVLEETFLQNWMAGFPEQDQVVAIKTLVQDKKIATKQIVDKDVVPLNREQRRKRKDGKTEEVIESTYTFYTLFENADKDWHEKQFREANKTKEA